MRIRKKTKLMKTRTTRSGGASGASKELSVRKLKKMGTEVLLDLQKELSSNYTKAQEEYNRTKDPKLKEKADELFDDWKKVTNELLYERLKIEGKK